jgi:hypothetical protein
VCTADNTPSADYWLVEIAGLETGLSVDMLRYPTMQVRILPYATN